jgi:quinol monooxygenase YgiN
VDLTIVTMAFEAREQPAAGALADVLAKYVVVSRGHPGCRNIDLCASVTTPGRFVVIEKWESGAAQRAHFDSADMVDMANACRPLVAGAPVVELLDGVSAHDLA